MEGGGEAGGLSGFCNMRDSSAWGHKGLVGGGAGSGRTASWDPASSVG